MKKVRILFLVNRDPKQAHLAGGDQALWSYAKLLKNANNTVFVLARAQKGLPCYEKIDGIDCYRMGNSFTNPLLAFYFYVRFHNIVDLIFEDTLGGFKIPYLSALYSRVPVIAVWHQLNSIVYKEQFGASLGSILSLMEAFVARIYNKKAALIITYTRSSAKRLETLFDKDKLRSILLCLPAKFTEEASHQIKTRGKKKEKIILFVGKIRKYKRIHDILDAADIVAKSIPDIRVIIAGRVSEYDKDYLQTLYARRSRMQIADQVEVLTDVTEEQKIDLLIRSKLVVLPSPIEGFSYLVVEANTCGIPVIGTRGVPSEVLVPDYNGLVYQEQNIRELSEKILLLLNNETLYKRLSENSIEWARKFTEESTRKQLIAQLSWLKGNERSKITYSDRPWGQPLEIDLR